MHRRIKALFLGRHGMGGSGGGHGRFGHFGMMGEMGARKGKFLTSDELQLVALQLLSEKPRYGYEIIKAVEELSSGMYKPSPGMIYPVLTYLEELSFATPQMEGSKKLFQITEEGLQFIEQNRQQLDTVLDHLKMYGKKMAYFQNQMAQEEMTDERWADSTRDKLEFHDVRRELKLALFEKLAASSEEKQRVLGILKRAIDEIRKK